MRNYRLIVVTANPKSKSLWKLCEEMKKQHIGNQIKNHKIRIQINVDYTFLNFKLTISGMDESITHSQTRFDTFTPLFNWVDTKDTN